MFVRVVVARAKYRIVDDAGESRVETARMPPEALPRSLADVSLLAKVLTSKFHFGMLLFRQAEALATWYPLHGPRPGDAEWVTASSPP